MKTRRKLYVYSNAILILLYFNFEILFADVNDGEITNYANYIAIVFFGDSYNQVWKFNIPETTDKQINADYIYSEDNGYSAIIELFRNEGLPQGTSGADVVFNKIINCNHLDLHYSGGKCGLGDYAGSNELNPGHYILYLGIGDSISKKACSTYPTVTNKIVNRVKLWVFSIPDVIHEKRKYLIKGNRLFSNKNAEECEKLNNKFEKVDCKKRIELSEEFCKSVKYAKKISFPAWVSRSEILLKKNLNYEAKILYRSIFSGEFK